MTEQQLIRNGFKKIESADGFWYELNTKTHHFITNDNGFNKNVDEWHLGYTYKTDSDPFWFNNNLKEEAEFKIVFHFLTGVDFKLAHQRKLFL